MKHLSHNSTIHTHTLLYHEKLMAVFLVQDATLDASEMPVTAVVHLIEVHGAHFAAIRL